MVQAAQRPKGQGDQRASIDERRVAAREDEAQAIVRDTGINGPWEARRVVREHAHYGADSIKIYMTEDAEGSG